MNTDSRTATHSRPASAVAASIIWIATGIGCGVYGLGHAVHLLLHRSDLFYVVGSTLLPTIFALAFYSTGVRTFTGATKRVTGNGICSIVIGSISLIPGSAGMHYLLPLGLALVVAGVLVLAGKRGYSLWQEQRRLVQSDKPVRASPTESDLRAEGSPQANQTSLDAILTYHIVKSRELHRSFWQLRTRQGAQRKGDTYTLFEIMTFFCFALGEALLRAGVQQEAVDQVVQPCLGLIAKECRELGYEEQVRGIACSRFVEYAKHGASPGTEDPIGALFAERNSPFFNHLSDAESRTLGASYEGSLVFGIEDGNLNSVWNQEGFAWRAAEFERTVAPFVAGIRNLAASRMDFRTLGFAAAQRMLAIDERENPGQSPITER